MSEAGDAASFRPETFRKKHNLLLGRASELARPFLELVARAASRGSVKDPQSWRRGLIIGHNHMGDVLYRTGSLPVLARGLPNCEWTFLTAPESRDLLATNPHVAHVVAAQKGDNAWSIPLDAFADLRRRAFDVAICSNSIRYYPDLMLATALGIPNRVSFVHKGMSGLVTHPVAIEFPSPYAAYFRAIVASTTGLPADWSLRPQVFPHDDAAREADAVMEGLSPDLPVVACVLTTRQKHGNWPASFVVDVLRECRQGIPFRVAFCGSTGDLPALTAFASQYPYENAIVAGKLSILGFASFLARCRALVTLDSGPRHLGNAAGIPVVFARNMSHSQVEAGRYCDSETDIAPAGEYLTDQEIARVAAASSSAAAAHKLRQALAG